MRLTFHATPEEIRSAFQGDIEGRLRILWVVYHRGHRARTRPLKTGFQPTPWRCSRCRRLVKHPDDLRYALASTSRAARMRTNPRRRLAEIEAVLDKAAGELQKEADHERA